MDGKDILADGFASTGYLASGGYCPGHGGKKPEGMAGKTFPTGIGRYCESLEATPRHCGQDAVALLPQWYVGRIRKQHERLYGYEH